MSNLNLQDQIVNDSVFTIGTVFRVEGKDIVVKINKNKNLPHLFFNGRTIRNVSVGLSNYIKITKGFTEIICKVEGEYLEEDKYQKNKEYISEKQKIDRFLKVSVFGFYDEGRKFQHGIKEMPLIGSECRLLSREEFETLHQISDKGDISIRLGSLVDEAIQDIFISAKKLFAGHIGIFGNTGSGKSNTLAKMYSELFDLEGLGNNFKKKSKFIFIDFNGEYSGEGSDKILTSTKKVYKLRTKGNEGEKYPILKTEIEKLELLSILLDATEKTQKPFLHRAIDREWFDSNNEDYRKEKKNLNSRLYAILNKNDTSFNKPFIKKFINDFKNCGVQMLKDVDNDIEDIMYNSGTRGFYVCRDSKDIYHNDKSKGSNKINIVEEYFDIRIESLTDLQKIQFKILDQYYHEILDGYVNQEHINPLIGRMKKRFDMLSKVFKVYNIGDKDSAVGKEMSNVEVVDLKNVSLEIKKIIPLLICKTSYDEQKNKRDNEKENSLHIIIDEAHNILSESSVREAESWKDYRLETFEEIIKEGRKFGVFLTIASQRPSDISPTIISQLHNYFIHRLMNENDLRAVNKAVSYLDKLSFDSISNLSVGCCFIAGQMTQFPLSVKVELLDKDRQPQSETIDLDKLWKKTPGTSS